ncbi:MAG: 16S rRNA processing protein RimM [Spirochaetes bacterium]|nr:16S rRNA processing protein RimM [Spirochaetota bacterium]
MGRKKEWSRSSYGGVGKTKEEYLIVGRVTRPFGIKGEVRVLPITDDPTRYIGMDSVFIGEEGKKRRIGLEYAKVCPRYVIVKLEGYDTVEDADRLKDELLYVARDEAVTLDEGSYYHYDLNGCTVVTSEGKTVGTVFDIQNMGSCDVYFIRAEADGKEYLVPAIHDVVKTIDISEKRIVIEPLEGLF